MDAPSPQSPGASASRVARGFLSTADLADPLATVLAHRLTIDQPSK
jgi:hypothetical protein